MRVLVLLLVLFPVVLHGAGARVPVQVIARVPLVAEVEGPRQIVLAPGEVARIRVNVAANVPWDLRVHSPNAWALASTPLSGLPGGATDNSREVEISCSPQASGPQIIALIYTLMPR